MSSTPETPLSAPDHISADVPTSKRLLDQHTVVIQALGGSLVLAPVDLNQSPLKILDSATADGHWLRELATSLPASRGNKYVGTDINTGFFPKAHGPEFQFYKHNMADPWPLVEHSTFDLVHQRLSLPGAAPASLSQTVQNLFTLVKPGGWIQLVEAEQVAPDSGPVFLEFLELVRAVFDATEAGWKYAGQMRGWLEEAGAVDIEEVSVNMALGATNKNEELIEIGASSTAGAMTGLVMHAKAMELRTELTEEELDTLPERLYTELIEIGAHYPLRAVWGRKKQEKEL